jgi:two-component system, cell cycle sensor histidine kinase and response regulator CckA
MENELRVLLWNPAAERLLGWRADEVLGLPNPMTLGANADESRDFRERINREGRVLGERTRRIRRDATSVEVSISGALVRDARGAAVGYMVIASDLTERAKLEAQLRQAQKMEAVGQLAGGIAHDFNNLLTVIMSYSELLLASHGEAPALAGQLREIKEASERAATLTRQLLAFSRRQVLNPRQLELNETIAGVDRMLRRVLGGDVEVVTRLDPDLRLVRSDPGQFEQVLLNLAINARDAMPGGGTLGIETKNVDVDATFARSHDVRLAPGPYVCVIVSDTGVGIPADVRERIFEPFFTTKEPGRGTGLGLSTVHGIVEQSGGAIVVYSEPGHGTTFRLFFPAVRASEAALEMPALPPVSYGSELILLVEDDPAVRRVTCTILRGAGYEVVEATDGAHALAIMAQRYRDIDLVLTDLVMPEMGGSDFSREIRDRLIEVPIIFMSGYARSTLSDADIVAANATFLEKPFSAATLLQLVRRLLDRKR